MRNLEKDYFNPVFSHIYVEERIWEHPRTLGILEKFPSARVTGIHHYKDIFCRSGQNSRLQRQSPKLVLAAKEGTLLYPGAPVCQSFGNEHFYYASSMMNCIYDCEYCYLKGMYPTANLVVFVNIEDIFAKTADDLRSHPLYVCVSYDTDLLAMESIVGYAGAWSSFASQYQKELTIEIRTKCASRSYFQNREPLKNVIYAFTLSPEEVIRACEHHTPSLAERTACAGEAMRLGFPVRLCFDPMIYVPGRQRYYGDMLEEVFGQVDAGKLVDVSAGSFRIPADYLKAMRRQQPDSAVSWFPYENEQGVCHYPAALMERMEQFLAEKLGEKLPEEKIFLWESQSACSDRL